MITNIHIKTFRNIIVNINKASYKGKVVYNFRQKTPKDISSYFQSIDIKHVTMKDKTRVEFFCEKFNA